LTAYMVFVFNSFMIELFLTWRFDEKIYSIGAGMSSESADRHISQGFIIFMVIHYFRHL